MNRISVSDEVAAFAPRSDKRYDILYANAGFEFGFGRAGSYEGHSHRCFVDLLFSPGGIRWKEGGETATGMLVIVPARSYLPDVETDNFAFLKFCPDSREVSLPDKVSDRLCERNVMAFTESAQVTFPWFPHPESAPQTIAVSLSGSELKLHFSNFTTMLLVP